MNSGRRTLRDLCKDVCRCNAMSSLPECLVHPAVQPFTSLECPSSKRGETAVCFAATTAPLMDRSAERSTSIHLFSQTDTNPCSHLPQSIHPFGKAIH